MLSTASNELTVLFEIEPARRDYIRRWALITEVGVGEMTQ